jgi:hypothetical protein
MNNRGLPLHESFTDQQQHFIQGSEMTYHP